MIIPGGLRIALWVAEISDRIARRLAGDDLGDRLAFAAAADEFDLVDVPLIDRGEFATDAFRAPAPVVPMDEVARRRQARLRHPAGTALDFPQ